MYILVLFIDHKVNTKFFYLLYLSAINASNYFLTWSKSSPLYVILCAIYEAVSLIPIFLALPLVYLVKSLWGLAIITPVFLDILNFSYVYGW